MTANDKDLVKVEEDNFEPLAGITAIAAAAAASAATAAAASAAATAAAAAAEKEPSTKFVRGGKNRALQTRRIHQQEKEQPHQDSLHLETSSLDDGSNSVRPLNSQRHDRSSASSSLQVPPVPPLILYRKWVFTVVILVLGAAASAAFLTIGIVSSKSEDREQFHHEAEELAHAVQVAMNEYELFGLWVHQGCFKSATRRANINRTVNMEGYLGMCSRDEFRNLYLHLESQRQDFKFQAVQFVPKVYHEERAELERQAGAYYQEHYPNFAYQGITHPHYHASNNGTIGIQIEPREPAPFYWPVHYVEPLQGNEAAVELDAYTYERRIKVIDRTVETFMPTLSRGVRLVQETDPHVMGIILRHPGIPTSNLNVQRPTFLAQIVIRVLDLLERATSGIVVPKSVYLYDVTANPPSNDPDFLGAVRIELIDDETVRSNLPHVRLSNIPRPKSSYMYMQEINVADRRWLCAIVSQEKRPKVVYIILGGCVIFCACLLSAIWFQTHMSRVAKLNELRTQAQEEKSKSAQKQVQRERQINEFLSHEVRNPLSSAISALSFVSSTVNDTKECQIPNADTRNTLQYDLHVMGASLQFINELLRNMLDVHRSASKQMKIELNPTDIRQDILEPVASILFLRGASSSIQVHVECPDDLVCQADRMRLKQIVVNLASNAVKFVQKGYIRLRGDAVNGNVEISVEDSGPGIPESKRNRLFAKFQQSLDELNQGTGIGLALCKNLSDLMGAEICLDESFQSGIEGCQGTRFVIRLNQPPISVEHGFENGKVPRRVQEKAPLLNTSPGTMETEQTVYDIPNDLTVLFVDDDTILRRMFTRALKRTCPSWRIDEASNGETALRLTETKTFDLIFMDHYMASVEKQLLGTETIRALRSRGVTSIICGLSANDMEQQFMESGADCFLFKPFPCEKDALSVELLRVLGTKRDAGTLPV